MSDFEVKICPENRVYAKPRLMTDKTMHYCPGCSHGVIHKLIAETLVEMGLLDEAIGATGQLSSVAVNGQVVQVQFNQVTLAQTAEIVRRLEESPIVERTTVNTAATTEENGDLVSASILIQLQKEEEGE